MSNKIRWSLFILYLAIAGSYCGSELDTVVGDTPFFRLNTLLLFCSVLCVMLIPPIVCVLCTSIRVIREHRILRSPVLFLNAIFFYFALFLSLYKTIRRIDFDFYFLWYNIGDALPTLWKLYAPWFPVVILLIAGFFFFQNSVFSPLINAILRSPQKGWSILLSIFLFSFVLQIATIHRVRGSAAGFLYASFFSDRQLRNSYRELYGRNIAALRNEALDAVGGIDPVRMGDVIFVVKQESLNGFLVGPAITPQLLRASRQGILFSRFYANSIQSVRGYECILCGVPPSIAGAMIDDQPTGDLKKLRCMPEIFSSLGYHPLYFFGGSRNARIVHFAESIGFEKVLADDIMRPDDIKFDWGYREDVFFKRIHEYLHRHYVNEKLFVFIDTGATNHTPFHVLDDALLDKIPFRHPESFNERISNTTFVQDAYFGKLFDIYNRYYAKNASLIAMSDHAWPIMMHNDNIYNERGSYEENFMIPLLFVPPASQREFFATGSAVDHRFSQMDIYPTVLQLIGMKQKNLLGESFSPWLLKDQGEVRAAPQKLKISIQPYGGGFISAVRYPEKYLFDVLGRNVKVYDLAKDPMEQAPVIRDLDTFMPLLRDFFRASSR